MINKDIIHKRLALVKYLYKIGIEQSKQSETIASFSILSLHDSIEMFLKLLAEHRNIKSDNFNFLDYWTNIPTLTLKESLRNLNARRINIKHKGLLPSKVDIEISRVNATDFFEQNTIIHFAVEFKDISLLSLITYENVRSQLELSQSHLDENKIEECIENSAIAFNQLLHTYENSKKTWHGNSPFFFGKDLGFLSAFSIGINSEWDREVGSKLGRFVDRVKESLEGIQDAVKILSFGIDYKAFAKFKILTPSIRRRMDDTYVAEIWGDKKWTKENCQFCIALISLKNDKQSAVFSSNRKSLGAGMVI